MRRWVADSRFKAQAYTAKCSWDGKRGIVHPENKPITGCKLHNEAEPQNASVRLREDCCAENLWPTVPSTLTLDEALGSSAKIEDLELGAANINFNIEAGHRAWTTSACLGNDA